jgi:hypothetical protein
VDMNKRRNYIGETRVEARVSLGVVHNGGGG